MKQESSPALSDALDCCFSRTRGMMVVNRGVETWTDLIGEERRVRETRGDRHREWQEYGDYGNFKGMTNFSARERTLRTPRDTNTLLQ